MRSAESRGMSNSEASPGSFRQATAMPPLQALAWELQRFPRPGWAGQFGKETQRSHLTIENLVEAPGVELIPLMSVSHRLTLCRRILRRRMQMERQTPS